MSKAVCTRRRALAAFGSFLASSPLLEAQELIGEPAGRITPRDELANVLEVELVAKRLLNSSTYRLIADGERGIFDRITFRPRMNVDTSGLDLTTDLFGQSQFSPILVGPLSEQGRFHADGELATARGAAAAKATMVISSRSTQPVEKIIGEAKEGAFWYQVFPEPDMAAVSAKAQAAVKAGCKALCITVGTPYAPGEPGVTKLSDLKTMGNPALNWAAIDQLRKTAGAPVVLKGIMSPEEADAAAKQGIQGIVVSNYGGMLTPGVAQPMEMLPAVVDAVAGRMPVLVDGGFRRGTDIVKALAFGATAVMIGRPVLWGLTAYGDEGVQSVIEILQTELGRNMAMVGAPNAKALTRAMVKVHSR